MQICKNPCRLNTWKFILQLIISILTAIMTTLGVTSCMGAMTNF